MKELLAGNAARTDAVESASAVSGVIVLDAKGEVMPGSKLTLDVTKLQSDRAIRDGFIKRNTLNTARYPNVEFVPKRIDGLGGPPPASGKKAFTLVGDTTIKGVTKPMTWNVTAQFDQSGCTGVATSSFKLSDFGMTPPKAGPVISVEDTGNLQVSFQAAATRGG